VSEQVSMNIHSGNRAASRFNNDLRRRPESHDNQVQLTPPYILEPIKGLLGGIGLDPCTEPNNPTGANRFYAIPDDGCSLAWEEDAIFINPPYGEAKDRWIIRAIKESEAGKRIIVLVPASTETKVIQVALLKATSVLFVNARVQFTLVRDNGRKAAASHGSVILGFNVDLSPISNLGVVLKCIAGREPIQVRQSNRKVA